MGGVCDFTKFLILPTNLRDDEKLAREGENEQTKYAGFGLLFVLGVV
ncbi:unnamed protein product [Callosobruchus maculatus]|uniref:Uncharacterized protein n=1 Tax=Callosobruchus maculatus TaxID=64391 RepID=A0A653DRS1_CALMS|nr:unnamed protein product [Callosobruchus maculatus]